MTKAGKRGKATLRSVLLVGASFLLAPLAYAQDEDAGADPTAGEEDIVVVGTQIRGARIDDALPVTVIGEEDIQASAPTSGDDLFRTIPQAGDVTFNEARLSGGINDARGDTASINLRALGTGNTLMLINGRRMTLHPAIQTENLVPVATVNTNTIPVAGVRRVEVLRDGAAAIYGTDAVAGVVNTVLRDNFEGFRVNFEAVQTESADQQQFDTSFEWGRDFNGGRTNLSLFGSSTFRDPLYAREFGYTADSDLRDRLVGTAWEGDTDFRNNSLDTTWGEFRRLNPVTFAPSTSILRINGVAVSSTSSGAATFHVQPDTNPGCIVVVANGRCFDNSVLSTISEDENLRYNSNAVSTLHGETERANLFAYLNHDFGNIEFFAEGGFYFSDFTSYREQETNLSTQLLVVGADNYYNPFGTGPGRMAGVNVDAAGVAFELQDYRPADAGPLRVDVDQRVYRLLSGFRGDHWGWDWETAYVYSRADTHDTMYQPSLTLFQEALLRSTPDAYNPFVGGDPTNPGSGWGSENAQEVIDSFIVPVRRDSYTSLAMWDFRISRPDLFTNWAGDIGIAAGVELRRETYEDNRDDRLDGTITFTDVRGVETGSDVMGASPTPDTSGSRNVESAFLELAVPLVSPEMNIPFARSIDAQLALRYENYSLFGSVAKPKFALSWYPTDWLQVRSSWSEGFRAPNLPQQFERGILRSNGRTDWIRCEAELRQGNITNFDDCNTAGVSVQSNRSGSEDLQPEESENFTAGFVFSPPGWLPQWGELTITADYWRIEQTDVIGLLGDANALTLDYLLRVQGSYNENVLRADPTAEDIALFDGTGIAPVGEVIQVIDNYRNLNPREADGVDIGIYYEIDDTPLGDFDVKLNFARLLSFYQSPGPEQQALLDGQADGTIDDTISVPGAESLVEQNGRPKWRSTATVTWRNGNVGAGYYMSYVSGVNDTSASLADGTLWRVDSYQTHNLYLQYTFDAPGQAVDDLRIRVGARNFTDETPPLADSEYGFIGDLHSPRGRTWYLSLNKRF